MVSADHYDVIVIGSGPGGGALAQRLAPTGKRILMLERGGYLPRSRDNWDAKTVFVDGRYQAPDTWYGKNGESFHPGLHYYVGGNSKVYGAALFRLRERDFGELQHVDGVSPAWPLGYDVFEPYYCEAEALFHVHGQRGEDPNEPWSSKPYAYPPVLHEPRIQALNDSLVREGLHPFHLPLGIKLDQNPDGSATTYSPCIRCDAFDGFPCAINAKADAQVICVDPALAAYPNFTLADRRLCRDPSHRPGRPDRRRACEFSARAKRKSIRPTSWSSPAVRSARRCCCCARPTTSTRTGWPTRPARSAATTCGTT